MPISKLQKLVLADAEKLLLELDDEMFALARKYGFDGEIALRKTVASEFKTKLYRAQTMLTTVLEDA